MKTSPPAPRGRRSHRPGPSHHSVKRTEERFDVPLHAARTYVAEALARSRKLPWRFAAELLRRAPDRFKGHKEVRVAGAMLLLTRGKNVITVWQLSFDELVTVLIWRVMGVWVGLDSCPNPAVGGVLPPRSSS